MAPNNERLQKLKQLKRKVIKENHQQLHKKQIHNKQIHNKQIPTVKSKLEETIKKRNKQEKLLNYTIAEANNWLEHQSKSTQVSEGIKKDPPTTKEDPLTKDRQPTKEQLLQLAQLMNIAKKQKKDTDLGVYINRKNKEFNKQLSKHKE